MRSAKRIALLFAITYMVSYITRINFAAVISEIETATQIQRSILSACVTGSFITYGFGQVISGFFGDKFSPKNIITCGLIITVAVNICIPFCPNGYLLIALCSLNGFAQSLMWPPMVKLMTELFTKEEYADAATTVSWGSSLGSILVYLLAPVIISALSWKYVMWSAALSGLLMILFWIKLAPDVEVKKKPIMQPTYEDKPKPSIKSLFSVLMIAVCVGIVLQGMLRDGVQTWMPTYIAETYSLSNEISILTGVLLPVFGMICIKAASYLYTKKLTNPLLCSGVFFGVGAASALAIYLLSGRVAVLSVFFLALLAGCMHGVNFVLICMVPPFFKKNGNVSTVSGVLNSCTYIGSACSTYGIALLSENLGWDFTLLVWLGVAALGALACFVYTKPWSKQMAE